MGGRSRARSHRKAVLLVALLALFGALVAIGAGAAVAVSPPGPAPLVEVPADFVTNGPFVRCAWVLPDADGRATTGMQYRGDDVAEERPAEGPCAANGVIVASGNRHLAQIVANAGDLPSKRQIELWAAIEHGDGVAGIDGASFRVFYPDGNFKAEVAADVVPTTSCGAFGLDGEGATPAADSMFAAAVATGQVDAGFAGTLATRCGARAIGLYRAIIDLGYQEPCGEYRLEVHASGGAKTVAVHNFDVYCSQAMDVDFSRIAWGTLTPGTTKWAFGELRGSDVPTIVNRGSSGIEVGIRFSEMRSEGGGQAITEFGAMVATSAGGSATRDPIAAGAVAWFGSGAALCAGERASFDTAVHPPAGLGEGAYTGSVEILTRPVAYEAGCNNDLGYWSGLQGSQRVGFEGSGPAPSAPRIPEGSVPVEVPETTTTTTTAVAGGTTTTTTVPGATTTVPQSTTTTTTEPPDPTAGYPIPFITVTATFEGADIAGLAYTATIQPGVTVGSDAFDLNACWPLLHIDGNGDGRNDGDLNGDAAMNPGEGWVFSCGFGQQPNPPVVLPFDPALLLNP